MTPDRSDLSGLLDGLRTGKGPELVAPHTSPGGTPSLRPASAPRPTGLRGGGRKARHLAQAGADPPQ